MICDLAHSLNFFETKCKISQPKKKFTDDLKRGVAPKDLSAWEDEIKNFAISDTRELKFPRTKNATESRARMT